MGGKRTERHRWKEHIYSLYQELQADYGLSVIESRALVARLSDFIDESYEEHRGLRRPGQVRHVVVADGQPAGRRLSHCVTVPVLLTVVDSSDAALLLERGSVALRQARLIRMAHEARDQGGLLTYEDLSLLLSVDVSTVRRQVAACRKRGYEVPTRGRIADIGPGTTHRTRVIELLFRGLQPAAIAAYTSHALSSVERYITDFARIVELVERGYCTSAIVRITALSPRTVREHIALKEQYSSPVHRPVLEMLFRRFYPLMADIEKEDLSWE